MFKQTCPLQMKTASNSSAQAVPDFKFCEQTFHKEEAVLSSLAVGDTLSTFVSN